MKRVPRDAIRMRIAVALSVFPRHRKQALGLAAESAREALADELTTRIMGAPESEAVILEPSNAGPFHSPCRGKWGVDEPHPFPDVPIAQH